MILGNIKFLVICRLIHVLSNELDKTLCRPRLLSKQALNLYIKGKSSRIKKERFEIKSLKNVCCKRNGLELLQPCTQIKR